MRKIHKNISLRFQPEEWTVTENEFNENVNKENETIFTLANGYIGVRGFFEEGFYGKKENTDPAVMLNGVYEYYPYKHIWCRPGFPERFHTIINQVNPIDVTVFADGGKICLGNDTREYSRVLNMYEGTVVRSFVYVTETKKQIRLKYTRFVSQTEKNVMAIRIEIDAEPDTEIKILSRMKPLDDIRSSQKEEIGSEIDNPFIYVKSENEESSYIAYKTVKSNFSVCCSVKEKCDGACEEHDKNGMSLSGNFAVISNGDKIIYDRFIAFASSESGDDTESIARETVCKAAETGFDELLLRSKKYWADFWAVSDIKVDGDKTVQQGIRFGLFMINQSAGKDGKTNISANGLTGTAYSGHTFWDTEIFMMPMFTYAHPEIARQLLLYRYKLLPKAKERARQMDDVGALYSWNSINGEECGHVFEAATAQYHINCDIYYAIYRYYEATDDFEFIADYGMEILLETSKCLLHRGFFSERKDGRFCIDCVCGPDEYNPVVDNNLYTNYLTKKQFIFTVDMFERLLSVNSERAKELQDKCDVSDEELSLMRTAAEKMYLPFDNENGIYMQDDNFIYKEPVDIENIPIEKLPLLTHLHPLNLWRYQVCKQADIVLLTFLQSGDFASDMKKKIFDYYEPKTIHDSSLSASIHSIVACDIGYGDEAYGYLLQACRMDLDNVNRNVAAGIHAACMGSCYMMIVNGYAGMRVCDGILRFRPIIPKQWNEYSFNVKFKNVLINVIVRREETIYTLVSGKIAEFYHSTQFVSLNEKNVGYIGRNADHES